MLSPQQYAEGIARAERSLAESRHAKARCIEELGGLVRSLAEELSGLAEGKRLGMALARHATGDILYAVLDCASMFIGVGEVKAAGRVLHSLPRFRALYHTLAQLIAREHSALTALGKLSHDSHLLQHAHVPHNVHPPGRRFNQVDPHGKAVDEIKKRYLHDPKKPKPHGHFPELGFSVKGPGFPGPKIPLAPGHKWKFTLKGYVTTHHPVSGKVMGQKAMGVWTVV